LRINGSVGKSRRTLTVRYLVELSQYGIS